MAALDEDFIDAAVFALNETIWAPDGPEDSSLIQKTSLYAQLWLKFQPSFSQHAGKFPGMTALAEKFQKSLFSMSDEQLKLLEIIWHYTCYPAGNQLNFGDIFFSAYNSKFNSHGLDTHSK